MGPITSLTGGTPGITGNGMPCAVRLKVWFENVVMPVSDGSSAPKDCPTLRSAWTARSAASRAAGDSAAAARAACACGTLPPPAGGRRGDTRSARAAPARVTTANRASTANRAPALGAGGSAARSFGDRDGPDATEQDVEGGAEVDRKSV